MTRAKTLSSRILWNRYPPALFLSAGGQRLLYKVVLDSDHRSSDTASDFQTIAAFDPKPFIRTFEHALSRLESLSEDLVSHETELLTAVRRAELQHSQTLDSLGRKLDQSIDSFQSLDISLGQANGSSNRDFSPEAEGNVAVRIGERLEELDQQSRRALDAKFLIQCWLEVSGTGELTSLEDIRRHGGGEGKVRCAVAVRQLTRISQRLDPSSWNQTNGDGRRVNGINGTKAHGVGHNIREIIEKFAETLEKDLLKQFDDFYRKQNFDGMRVRGSHILFASDGWLTVPFRVVRMYCTTSTVEQTSLPCSLTSISSSLIKAS